MHNLKKLYRKIIWLSFVVSWIMTFSRRVMLPTGTLGRGGWYRQTPRPGSGQIPLSVSFLSHQKE